MHLSNVAPLKRSRHRLEEVFDAAANARLQRALELTHIDMQTKFRTVARIPRLL